MNRYNDIQLLIHVYTQNYKFDFLFSNRRKSIVGNNRLYVKCYRHHPCYEKRKKLDTWQFQKETR